MKKNLVTFLALLLFSVQMYAQNRLPESSKGSANLYIYSVDKSNLRKIHLKDKVATEDMLGKYITDFPRGQEMPKLARGNYLVASAVEGNLNISDYIIDDLYFKVIPSDEFMLCLYDSLGNFITDAIVKRGSQTLKYDKQTHTYNIKKVKHDEVIEVNNKGVYHYIEIGERGYGLYYTYRNKLIKRMWWGVKHFWHSMKYGIECLFDPDERSRNKYTGFVVFSKPQYKPGETVKFKAYMAKNGTPYNEPVDIQLHDRYPFKVDTILARVQPYRPGMYEYEFELSDKLNLTLDVSYTIQLKTGKKHYYTISDKFRYEDYELESTRFSMETDKDEYVKGDSVKLKFNVADENEMIVYDGKIELLVKSEPLNPHKLKKIAAGFVPDTLWTHTMILDGTLKREIIVPDSIFPPGISFDYTVVATYLSSNNEKKTAEKRLSRKADDYVIDFSLKKGMLTITQLAEGESKPVMADISVEGENNEVILAKSVMLPHTISLPWFATDVTVKTIHSIDCYLIKNIIDEQLEYRFYRQNDSIYLKVDNPANIPFWYTVCRNKSEITHGYTTQLDYAIKDNNQGYNMQIAYLFGDAGRIINKSLPFIQKNISMEVSTPTSVYPGQKANVQITVTDKKGKPVNNADITAYAFTSKFQNQNLPNIAIHGKSKYARDIKTIEYKTNKDDIKDQKIHMTWNRWKTSMALDTVEYYNFLYPETYYVYTEPTADKRTLISPYIVVDGALQMIHMLWIDDRLYYTNASEQWNVYSFAVEPGNHTLKFRTYNRDVSVHNLYIKEGERNIFSFNAASPYTRLESMDKERDLPLVISSRLRKKKEHGTFTDNEKEYLASQLITIDNNFGEIQFPNVKHTVDIPAYIKSGDTYYYINHNTQTRYDYTLKGMVNAPVLMGPFPKRSTMNGITNLAAVYRDSSKLLTWIDLEGGNKYTVYPGYQKIKGWNKAPFIRDVRKQMVARDFRETPLTVDNMLKHAHGKLLSTLQTTYGPAETRYVGNLSGKLELYLGKHKNGEALKPALLFIVPEEKKDIGKYQLYYGGTRNFVTLPTGKINVSLIFNDSTSYTKQVTIYPNGKNFLNIDSISYGNEKETAITAFTIFNRGVKKVYPGNPYQENNTKDSVVTIAPNNLNNLGKYRKGYINQGTISGIIYDDMGEPVIGASIFIAGTTIGTISNLDGYFELSGVSAGAKIEVSYIGYLPTSVEYNGGYDYNIQLNPDNKALEEVIVVGYGVQKKGDLINNVTSDVESALTGKIRIRGASGTSEQPLILVNGLPFEGDFNHLNEVISMDVLRDPSLIGIYGSRAANGVIMIQTKDPEINLAEVETNDNFPIMEGNAMRRNFHDDAFWQPRLATNEKGEASFEVTYPDDITSWNAYFIAIGNKKQTDKKQITIKSFKALVAALSTPRFAVRGDSLNMVGKITNRTGDSISVKRKINFGEEVLEENLRLSKSHIDYIPVSVQIGDSITLSYSLQMESGYFDGEERSFPIIEQGMEQTYGYFNVLNDTVTQVFTPNPALGTVTIHAEASSLEMFLKEIEKVDKYPYMCNEQMASKIKVLLSKKQIARMFGKEFKEDNKVNNLINRLHKNTNSEGLWGWWNKERTEQWISNQVISALLDAEEAGYKSNLNIPTMQRALTEEVKNGLANLRLTTPNKVPYAKQELLQRLITLKRINAPIEYEQYLEQINQQLPSRTLTDKLKVIESMAVIGLQNKINIDSLMHYSRKTMLGSLFWGDEEEHSFYRGFYVPYNNNVNNTLIAYRILKVIGGYEKELERVRNYFFERRQGGAWANTYESSRIIETIMPDMLTPDRQFAEVIMTLNNKRITKFPFTEEIESPAPLYIKKEGTAPVFVTVYQQSWNPDPQPESSKGFAVRSVFTANGDSISNLTAGSVAQLEVTVTVEADAEYVQIEIPIPAGCSYDSKKSGSYSKEVHREHFKDKVVIFSNKLTKGKHTFSVDLIPRFTGRYILNPAKVELMYFPVFYGNEKVRVVNLNC
ncbi:carboxypeptidase-like regulatory domain-containing protein [Bacteroides sp. 519]|uniref:carboxypeptidase-like regulatory domain-containing protein n=1 Tax=Bacteroides sp. 519 TaxID=2302937 RepID=UPI0013CF75BE|nr:carboxypeptidase-like regulatory domain-containing protein [Bacteroides sp. 519]NDV59224.1 hypothetical protein [Bacteroides sp. 519]